MAWKEIKDDIFEDTWMPKEEGDSIEGVLVEIKENVGVNKSKLYKVQTDDGLISVWGSTILDSRLEQVPVGAKIKIVYQGLGKAKAGRNAPKLFKVYIDTEYRDYSRDPEGNPIVEEDENGIEISN